HSDNSCKELLSQLRLQLVIRLFSITPSQANCEQNFSTLKWLLGDHRTRMNITKLEGMAKARSYYLSNICNELKYYRKELTENDIRSVINNTNMGDILELDNEESEIGINNNILNNNYNNSLIIENIIDLNNFENENEISNEINDDEMGTLDYNPEDIINNFLFDELNKRNNELELNEMELNERNNEIESN
ncbi:6933_t:CDS:2, partial [Diversispora eburnea]